MRRSPSAARRFDWRPNLLLPASCWAVRLRRRASCKMGWPRSAKAFGWTRIAPALRHPARGTRSHREKRRSGDCGAQGYPSRSHPRRIAPGTQQIVGTAWQHLRVDASIAGGLIQARATLLNSGDLDQAINVLSEAIRVDPENAHCYTLRAARGSDDSTARQLRRGDSLRAVCTGVFDVPWCP